MFVKPKFGILALCDIVKIVKRNKHKLGPKATGIISISSKGTGYVQLGSEKKMGQDPEISSRKLNTALHGDTVEIALIEKSGSRPVGEVIKIIRRAKLGFAGVLQLENNIFFMKPDDTKMYTDILIPKESLNGAALGQKVYAEIVSWNDPDKAPLGKVVKILGDQGENNAEMHAIALEKGFEAELPQSVEEEAQKLKAKGITENDYLGRRDFRKVLTFTIDPSDAKDFDDAISFRVLPSHNFEIGIHIADVCHYVKPGTALDEEAKTRGTSVYLVDRTIPMLPEALSNDLCSLVPAQDRLTMSAVFTLDRDAHVKDEWYGRTVIHSQKRFTYEEAEETIKKTSLPYHKELSTLNHLAKKLTKKRFDAGAISLDQEEIKFVLDEKGVPIKVVPKERGDSNRLIEEFMLLANKKVAELISGKKGAKRVSLYRIHDLPNIEKMADLAYFLRSLGHKVSLRNGVIPSHEINSLLAKLKGKNEANTVQRAIIRSMAKAIYSTKNIGHYGLAFEYYTHFTSPIRRYPDIIVHRLLMEFLAGHKVSTDQLKKFDEIALISSDQEKRAADAERASIKYKQVEYMSRHVGKTFKGIISSITEWGMYVEEEETKCEGLVRVRDLEDDFYIFNEKTLELVGRKKKKKYRLGGEVKIKVKAVDQERKTIDYTLV
jgi:ribonuclease R